MNTLEQTIRATLEADAATYVPAPALPERAVRAGHRARRRRLTAVAGSAFSAVAVVTTVMVLADGPQRVAIPPATTPTASHAPGVWAPERYHGAVPTGLIAATDAQLENKDDQNTLLVAGTLSDSVQFYFYYTSSTDNGDSLNQSWGRNNRPLFGDSGAAPLMGDTHAIAGTYPGPGEQVWLVVAGQVGTGRLTYVPGDGAVETPMTTAHGIGALLLDGPPDWGRARVRGYDAVGALLFEQQIGTPEQPTPGAS